MTPHPRWLTPFVDGLLCGLVLGAVITGVGAIWWMQDRAIVRAAAAPAPPTHTRAWMRDDCLTISETSTTSRCVVWRIDARQADSRALQAP